MLLVPPMLLVACAAGYLTPLSLGTLLSTEYRARYFLLSLFSISSFLFPWSMGKRRDPNLFQKKSWVASLGILSGSSSGVRFILSYLTVLLCLNSLIYFHDSPTFGLGSFSLLAWVLFVFKFFSLYWTPCPCLTAGTSSLLPCLLCTLVFRILVRRLFHSSLFAWAFAYQLLPGSSVSNSYFSKSL